MSTINHFITLLLPLFPYLCVAAGTFVCAYLFLSLKKELYGVRRRMDEKGAVSPEALASFEQKLEELKRELRDLEQLSGGFAPPPAGSGINLTKRTQVLRMVRNGAGQADIASTLHLPRGEVDLLVKVHKLSSGQARRVIAN